MALTTYAISQASDHLSEKSVKLWQVLFRKSTDYLDYISIYGDDCVEDKLLDLDGTIEARMLNALMKEIDELGVGEVSIAQRSKEGLRWSQTDERMALIEEALHIVFGDNLSLLAGGTYADAALAASKGSQTAARGSRTLSCNCINGLTTVGCTKCNC